MVFVAVACIVLTVVVVLSWQKMSEKSDPGNKTPDADNNPLEFLIESTFGSTGDTFFYSLARELSQFLSIDSVLLASCEDKEQGIYSTLAYWCDGSYIMNQIISVLNSPCEDINGLCYLETSAGELYPEAALLNTQFKVAGFFAIRLLDSSGNPVGLLAGMHRSALRLGKEKLDIIKLFSLRAAAEL